MPMRLDTKAFPFLIGTVRTNPTIKANAEAKAFPFLIGTVRTFENAQ